ncbi:MAG: hypothetical protein B6I22_10585 [Desulfobacteraceae bacterium 4572_123]|nr:MAG: hypothetical protein B6I22_10585 [Desulfobacteraceae bacterium 4572_123]
MNKKTNDAVIVGGGVIGAFTAYYLLEKGWHVTIVDKGRFGSGSSEGNCGLVLPNYILPVNMPGTLLKAFKWMFTNNAPLYVKPRFNLDLIQWLFNFSRKCTMKAALSAARGRHVLLQRSFELFLSIMEKEKLQCNWDVCGSLHVYRTKKEWEAYREVVILLRDFGIPVEPLDHDALARFEPGLSPDLYGGWLSRQTAHLWPEKLMDGMYRLLTGRGVTVMENSEVMRFQSVNGRVVAVETGEKTIPGAEIVIAAGAWTPMLAKQLGCTVPIQPGKGYSITTGKLDAAPSVPCFFDEKSVVATPWPDGFRLGGTMEFSGYDDTLNQKRLTALSTAAVQYIKGSGIGDIEKEWCGLRPMTYDGLPIIDRSPLLENVTIAAGHNMLGLSMGPGTGQLVAEMLNGEPPHIDPKPYALKRFSQNVNTT